LIFPGLGQVRAGSWSLGVTLLGVAAAAAALLRCLTWLHMEPLAFAVFATVRAAYILLAIAAAVDAVRRTRRTVKASRPVWLRSTWRAFIAILVVNGTVAAVVPTGWHAFNIPAGSMAPTLLVGDYLVAGDLSAGFVPARGMW